jgi:tRNA-dihydrouridine synthase
MAEAFREAGGDLLELNCHGSLKKLNDRGLLRSMARPENRARMLEWLGELCRLSLPVLVKFWGPAKDIDWSELLTEVRNVEGLFGIHFNVRNLESEEPDLDLVRLIRGYVDGMLLCSGYVTSRAHVDSLLEAGTDCVGVAQGVLDKADLIAALTQK